MVACAVQPPGVRFPTLFATLPLQALHSRTIIDLTTSGTAFTVTWFPVNDNGTPQSRSTIQALHGRRKRQDARPRPFLQVCLCQLSRIDCSACDCNTDCLWHSGRNFALLSFLSLGGGYMVLKMRTLQAQRQARPEGDFSVAAGARSGGGI